MRKIPQSITEHIARFRKGKRGGERERGRDLRDCR